MAYRRRRMSRRSLRVTRRRGTSRRRGVNRIGYRL